MKKSKMKAQISSAGLLIYLIFLSGCEMDEKKDLSILKQKVNKELEIKKVQDSIPKILANKVMIQKRDSFLFTSNLVDVQSIDTSIHVELKYATPDNFMKKVLYFKLRNAYLQKDVAERLSKVQEVLLELRPGYHLLIYDAVRPVSVQQRMWDALDTISIRERGKFVSNPANKSVHNYGAAVDLTIADNFGKAIDMGAGYDDIREIAYPSLEAKFLKSGELTKEQVENRKLLRKVMQSQGFSNIKTEWWHFNACSRGAAKARYTLLMEEF
jgi:D-alanyl-D-alanine dipeptidase